MNSTSSDRGANAQGSSEAAPDGRAAAAPQATGHGAGDDERAAVGPIAEPVPVTANPLPARRADSPAEAEGRRTLSTAFVMMGPGGHLTVELRNGRVLLLRDLVMRPRDYCGLQVLGGRAGARYCGSYADVAAARPGGASTREEPNPAVSNPVESARSPGKRN